MGTGENMTDQKLKKLSRKELLEVMVAQSKEIEQLKEQLRIAEQKLESRDLTIQNAGSIAEAALQLNQIFQDADAAAKQYVDSVQQLERQQREALARIEGKEKAAGQTAPPKKSDEMPSVWRKIT
jgi:hypothetical protein